MERFALPTVLLLAIFQLCPPMFMEGSIFDVSMINDEGVLIHGVYFDNVYNVILYLFLSWISISLPFLFKTLPKEIRYLSLLSGAWWIIGCSFEVYNLSEPLKVYNTPEIRSTYGYLLLLFIIGVTLIIINKKWSKLA
tara:strand:- start:393 stop:806 length:414 start_codon:yes stop_codon:yes gene_type:complete